MTKYWVGVVSKNHVMVGVDGGFCQLNHGKKAALSRMKKGDQLLFYAPKQSLVGKEPYQKIIALGTLNDDLIYQVEMSPDFSPYRRNITYEKGLCEVDLAWLNRWPEWQAVRSKLRFGHLEISKELFTEINKKMRA